ncbi:MAG: type II toxin-antitoxin system HicB family antitoxin [Hyphomicrobiales bacterium]
MTRLFYPACLEKEPDSAYGVTFPDLPGCVSAGATAEEALVNAHEALAGHIALMVEDGDTLPKPTPVERVVSDPEVAMIAVSVIGVTIPGRAKRVNVTLDEALLDEIDSVATNRSRFLAEAARAELARRQAG